MSQNEDYSQNIVKEYRYWTWLVHTNQGYLGRSVLWCKRENALDLTETTAEESAELFEVLLQMKKAFEKAFQANWMNYAFLGNETRHLHGHVIPRYDSERMIEGVKFIDTEWGHNWKTDRKFQTPPELLQAIKKKLQESIEPNI